MTSESQLNARSNSNEYSHIEHVESSITSSISSSPAISNSSSAASSSSTLPVDNGSDQPLEDPQTENETEPAKKALPVTYELDSECKKRPNASDYTSVRVAVRWVLNILRKSSGLFILIGKTFRYLNIKNCIRLF